MSVTAVADVGAATIHAVVEIASPPERVFHALSDPAELGAWWGSAEMYRTSDWKVDLRPGGAWSCVASDPAGKRETVRGEYLAVEPPRLLEYTWLASWESFAPTVVRIEIAAAPGGSRVTVKHSGLPAPASTQGTAEGWKRVLGWMTNHLAEVARAST